MSKRIVTVGLCALVLGTLVLTSQPATAQEQENPSTPGQIPDPGTYQGSMVLQQQSDQQDQQYREQQQQQSQQQSSGNYGGGSGYRSSGGGSTRMDPSGRCFAMLQGSPALASLRGLVELGVNNRDSRYFVIARRPTAAERPALLRWASGRRNCPLANFQNAAVTRANAIAAEITNRLIVQLAHGLMTYGEFNYKRALNSESFLRFRDSH